MDGAITGQMVYTVKCGWGYHRADGSHSEVWMGLSRGRWLHSEVRLKSFLALCRFPATVIGPGGTVDGEKLLV